MNQVLLKIEFNNRVEALCKTAERLSTKWSQKKGEQDLLLISTYQLFLQAMDCLSEDEQLSQDPHYFSNLYVRRLQSFQQLSINVSRLAKLVSRECREEQDLDLPQQVLMGLNERINALSQKILPQGRLPINYDGILEQTKQRWKDQLELKVVDLDSLRAVEKETFHVLASTQQDFKGVRTEKLEGNVVGKTFLTLINLLDKTFMPKERNQEKKRFLLQKLQGALRLAIKLDSAAIYSKENSSIYFEKLKSFELNLAQLEQQGTNSLGWNSQQNSKFFNFANISKGNVSREIFVNDLCWDVLKAIEQLRDGEYILIPMGTTGHCVLAQVELHIVDGKPTYTYYLFNTGNGCLEYHFMDLKKETYYVKPLQIEGIEKKGLSYSFWKEAFNCYLTESNIHTLYRIQKDYLVKQGKGRVQLRSPQPSYPLPDFGICSYGATEMAVFNQLSRKEKKQFERSKAIITVRKQAKVVHLRNQHIAANAGVRKGTIKQIQAQAKQSLHLLQVSRTYLRQISKRKGFSQPRRQFYRSPVKISRRFNS